MVCVLVIIWVFISATGAWSSHSGFAALFFLILFAWALAWGVKLAFWAPSLLSQLIGLSVKTVAGKDAGRAALNVADVTDILVNSSFIVPIILIAISAFFLYMLGLGDWLTALSSSVFPKGGYLFTEASAGVADWIAWAYLVFLNYSYFKRFS